MTVLPGEVVLGGCPLSGMGKTDRKVPIHLSMVVMGAIGCQLRLWVDPDFPMGVREIEVLTSLDDVGGLSRGTGRGTEIAIGIETEIDFSIIGEAVLDRQHRGVTGHLERIGEGSGAEVGRGAKHAAEVEWVVTTDQEAAADRGL